MTLFSAISAAVINQGSQWEQSDLTQPTLTILLPFLRLQFWRESQLLQGNQKLISQTQPTEENCCKETNWFTLSGPVFVSALSKLRRCNLSSAAGCLTWAAPRHNTLCTPPSSRVVQPVPGLCSVIRAANEPSAKFSQSRGRPLLCTSTRAFSVIVKTSPMVSLQL